MSLPEQVGHQVPADKSAPASDQNKTVFHEIIPYRKACDSPVICTAQDATIKTGIQEKDFVFSHRPTSIGPSVIIHDWCTQSPFAARFRSLHPAAPAR